MCLGAAAQGVIGKGQFRAISNEKEHLDLGCITNVGRWTTDETQCGVFEATPVGDRAFTSDRSFSFTLKSAAGTCWAYGAKFLCEEDGEPFIFGTWPDVWPIGLPGVSILRYGQYGLMASVAGGPPARTAEPQEIRFTSYTEPGQRIWLKWEQLE
ncbi:hypothetical protein OQA88_10793 [Cercophora sp. LCS_1]